MQPLITSNRLSGMNESTPKKLYRFELHALMAAYAELSVLRDYAGKQSETFEEIGGNYAPDTLNSLADFLDACGVNEVSKNTPDIVKAYHEIPDDDELDFEYYCDCHGLEPEEVDQESWNQAMHNRQRAFDKYISW